VPAKAGQCERFFQFTSEEIKKYLKKGVKSKRKHYKKNGKTILLENWNWIMRIFEISLYNHTLNYAIKRCKLV